MRITLAPTVARGFDTHQTRIHAVLDIALQNAVFDQNISLAHMALIIDVERATPLRQSAIVQDRDALGRHSLANATRKGTGAFAVEVAL